MTRHLPFPASTSGRGVMLAGLILALGLAGCASAPRARDPGAAQANVAPARLPPTQVFFYPRAGQSPAQQDRDRFECYRWASGQTGFDPSLPRHLPQARVQVTPQPPPGRDMAVGALGGAVLGAAVAGPGDVAGGAAVGAVAGAVIGAASDATRQERAERIEPGYARADARRLAGIESKAADWRRAMAACLEGRGYSVQ